MSGTALEDEQILSAVQDVPGAAVERAAVFTLPLTSEGLSDALRLAQSLSGRFDAKWSVQRRDSGQTWLIRVFETGVRTWPPLDAWKAACSQS
jgi:hypothetical protein